MMKIIFSTIAFCLLILNFSWSKTEGDASQAIDRIIFNCGESGWILSISDAGSAYLQYGSSGFDSAKSENGAFDLELVLQTIQNNTTNSPPAKNSIAISIQKKGDINVESFYIKDESLIKNLFEKTLEISTPLDFENFSKLLKSYPIPIIPDAKLVEKTESKPANIENKTIGEKVKYDKNYAPEVIIYALLILIINISLLNYFSGKHKNDKFK